MNTANILIYGGRGGTSATLITVLTNAVDRTWDAVQPTICDVDGALVEKWLVDTVFGSGKETLSMTFSCYRTPVHHNVKCAVRLSRLHRSKAFVIRGSAVPTCG